jgi:hypothetical protein
LKGGLAAGKAGELTNRLQDVFCGNQQLAAVDPVSEKQGSYNKQQEFSGSYEKRQDAAALICHIEGW